jgi:hypothetical protein
VSMIQYRIKDLISHFVTGHVSGPSTKKAILVRPAASPPTVRSGCLVKDARVKRKMEVADKTNINFGSRGKLYV